MRLAGLPVDDQRNVGVKAFKKKRIEEPGERCDQKRKPAAKTAAFGKISRAQIGRPRL